MQRSVRMMLLGTSVLAAAMSALFALAYSSVEMNISDSIDLELPQVTKLFATLSLWAMLLPVLLLAAVLATIRSRHAELVSLIVTAVGFLFALGWPLLCLLMWRFPRTIIGIVIE